MSWTVMTPTHTTTGKEVLCRFWHIIKDLILLQHFLVNLSFFNLVVCIFLSSMHQKQELCGIDRLRLVNYFVTIFSLYCLRRTRNSFLGVNITNFIRIELFNCVANVLITLKLDNICAKGLRLYLQVEIFTHTKFHLTGQ